jgi:hypothetical protein
MAGFLTHIAARLGEPEGQLRPRRPSLFEPPVAAASDLVLVGAPTEGLPESAFERIVEADVPAVGTPPAAASPARRRRTRLRAAGPAGPDHPADPPPEPAVAPSAARPAAALARRTAPAASAAPAAPAEPTDGPRATRDAPVPKGSGRAIRPTGIAASPRTVSADPAMGPAMGGDPARMETRPAAGRGPVPRRDDATAAAADAPRDMAATPAAPASGILQAPMVARIMSDPPPARAQRSEPAIHVTIGRVEIRAVAAAPSDTTRRERPSPVMSLDDYLRMRAR